MIVLKVDQLNLGSQNQAKNIYVASPCSPIKNCGKSVQGFLSYDKQPNWDYSNIFRVSQKTWEFSDEWYIVFAIN